jgi:mRNA-degrading endonuclease RelE of RelBE toxin-antitoxin system
MSYNILRTDEFTKHLKQLAKKYPSTKIDYGQLLDELVENPILGTPLGKNCYKIRMIITSKKKGKSGDARVITYVKIEKKTITLLDIYDKGDKESMTDNEILAIIKSAE